MAVHSVEPLNSKIWLERARKSLAGGVSSQFRVGLDIIFDRAEGGHIWDVDGREYIDWTLSQGPMILGHGHPAVLSRVEQAMRRGVLFAGQHVLEVLVSEKVQAHVPCAELVRYSSVGSEAVQAALRAARSLTGRRKYIKFEGHYHGWFDNVAISIKPSPAEAGPDDAPVPVAWSKGQSPSVLEDVIVLPWNDLDVVRRAVEAHGREIAAIITEPVMCNNGCIPPEPGFLAGLREICDAHGIVLIFDEIITGFRLSLGGAQAYYGVTPDIATFAKAMANGFPVSMIAGKRSVMEVIARGEAIHAGTYNSNTIAMAASLATIEELEKLGPEGYKALTERSQRLQEGLRELARENGLPVLIQGVGPVFHMGFTKREKVTNYRHTLDYDERLYQAFVRGMLARGVRVIGRGLWYLSFAHTDEDVERTLAAASETLRELAR